MSARYNPDQHYRRSIRLPQYDYASAGAYFITLCCYRRQSLFGKIVDGQLQFTEAGAIAQRCWAAIPEHFPQTKLDAFVIMPNRLHGILILRDGWWNRESEGTPTPDDIFPILNQNPPPPREGTGIAMLCPNEGIPTPDDIFPNDQPHRAFGKMTPGSIPAIVRSFKSAAAKQINGWQNTPGTPIWQRNYYEHIVRNRHALQRIRQYIRNNPSKWQQDRWV